MKKYFYVYYSYEPWGRGYIGKRECECLPEEDVKYFGSYTDKTFKPTEKIILEVFNTRKDAYEAEKKLHDFYEVHKNPHFANRSKITNDKFYYVAEGKNNPMYGRIGKDHPAYGNKHSKEVKKNISEGQRGEKNHMYGKFGKEHPSYGTKRTEETKRKLSEGRRGEKNHRYGKKSWHSGKSIMMWITNGIESRYVFRESGIPEGWRRGRTFTRGVKKSNK